MRESESAKCPLCESDNVENIISFPDFIYGHSLRDITYEFSLSYCRSCELIFQSSAYNDPDYDTNISKMYKSYNIQENIHFPNRTDFYTNSAKFASKFIENKPDFDCLEIGSNRGDFLYLLKEKNPNINLMGIEPMEGLTMIPTICGSFGEVKLSSKFDFVALRHVLEHVKYPADFIKEVQKLLKPDGVLFIEVPDTEKRLVSFTETFQPDHVSYFTLNSLMSFVSFGSITYEQSNGVIYMAIRNDGHPINSDVHLDSDVKNNLGKYFENMNSLAEKLAGYENVYLYGVGHFFYWFYSVFKEQLSGKNIYYIDDFINENPLRNIQAAEKIDDDKSVVVLCSGNIETQAKMLKNITKYKADSCAPDVLSPFRKVMKWGDAAACAEY